ncbi:MAG: sugar ABC transporter substrate-binding protein [Ardenticatenaceae bacterium]|nr:sugar ABC transporter substrate-binding protein [Ardenticatenaceae bacterium]MCB9442600.1 sugar ABC transporter substrate-binding protein [Ardenticatenaceae bacterium]
MKHVYGRYLSIFLILLLVVGLVACGGDTPTESPAQESDPAAEAEAAAAAAAEAEAKAAELEAAEAAAAEAETRAAEAEAALAEAQAALDAAADASAEELAAAQAALEAAEAEASAAAAEAEAATAAAEEAAYVEPATLATYAAVAKANGLDETTIVVSWPSLSHFQKAQSVVEEFSAATGINVELDYIEYQAMRDKQILELSKPAGQGEYDIVAWVVFNKTDFVNKGYLTDLSKWFTNAALTDPTYDREDLVPAYVNSGSVAGGRRGYLSGPTSAMYGVPFGAEASIMAYRADIFEEYGLEVPTTYDEMFEVAEFITENVPDMYGMTSRGQTGGNATHAWLLHASPYGADIFDDQWNVTLDTPQALAATQALKRIVENSPPGVLNWGFGEEANAFLQGDSAIYVDALKIAAMSRDPEQSLVDGKVGYALHPVGPEGICGAETGGFSMGIAENSANKEAAYLFLQYMTSKEGDRRVVEAGGDPVRLSTMADPELQARFPEYPVILEQLACANENWRPLIPEWGELNAQIMGEQIGAYLNDEIDAETALANAKAQTEELMERSGYYTTAAERYAPYAGTTIVVSWPSLSHFTKAEEVVAAFEAETGINVELDYIEYQAMRDKQVLELSKPAGQGEYDVVAWVVFNKTDYVSKGYLADLSQFFTMANLVDPTYDPDDIVPAYINSGSIAGGRRGYLSGAGQGLYGVPYGAEASIMAYRADIFEEYGLEVPTTYDEMFDVAEFITENVPDMYGMTSRGQTGGNATHAWLLHASPYGADIFDDFWTVTLDTPQALAATEALKRIVENSPTGVLNWGFGEEANAFLQGDSAIYVDALKIAAMSRDPEQSLVDGKVGYALHPVGPDGICGAETGGFSMGIAENSANKEAAFLFIQWMTSKEADRLIVEAGGDPIRLSTMADPEMQARFPEYPVILEQLACANENWRPLIPEWGEINAQIMGEQIGAYLNDAIDAETALATAKEQTTDVMARAGYYGWQIR